MKQTSIQAGDCMSAVHWIALVVALGLFVYLFLALLKPELFD